ncbi:TonB-dependent receptor plug domain-containing protein [Hymenobacter sp. BT507]|uniref:TonB-dependent receptor plug domain-containing protein n=1 Tax=Hymenobacter citatus TaxID=2763506 RepID=A0ABR7MJF1_9BACT|nr:M56 family metallopeptidase [Hymenobacter citatus]MBC6610994.1 TonB-dependent receptor plug domain-containing protein [Hymenobacter citatus]
MPALLLYLLKVNGALLLFYLGYWLVLRRLTFYTLNRWYLLFAVGFSAAYPAVDVSAWLARPVAVTSLALGDTWTYLPTTATPTFTYWTALEWCYWVGVGLLLLRLLMQLMALHRIRRVSQPAQWHGQRYRRVGAAMNPFSFGRTIYLNPAQHAPAELPAILRHEQVHVRQWHTLDVLVAQLAQVFYWFNPGVWLLRRAVQENLEFITDRAVLRAGLLDAKAYQYSLLKLSTLAPSAALANHFTFLTLKNRIAMMNKKRSATAYLGLYALLVPGLALFTLACSKPQVEPSTAARNTDVVIISQEAKENRGLNLPDNAIYFLDGKEGDKSLIANLEPKDISRIEIFKNESAQQQFGMGKEGGVIVVTTKANQDSEAIKAFQKKYNLANPKSTQDTSAKGSKRGIGFRTKDGKLLPDPLYVVNGTQVTNEELVEIDPRTIDRMEVLKGEEAVASYGAKGRNGVIIVTTKKN